MMILGTDAAGKVLMVSSGNDPSFMPTEFNGVEVMAHVLSDEQEAAYEALPSDRSGATFDGQALTALAAEPVVERVPEPTIADIIAVLQPDQQAALRVSRK